MMIQTTEDLAGLIASAKPGFCAIDMEADSLHRYKERICLIQFSDGEKHSLIDPLAIEDMSPFIDYMSETRMWLHGADYDMTMFRREYDTLPPQVLDTQIAGRLIGAKRFGYGNLVEDFLGVELSKSSQKADWAKRPLTDTMLQYALNDVIYLKDLSECFLQKLEELDRLSWFEESCDYARQKALLREQGKEAPWRIKGSGRLRPRGLAYLKSLWGWRDAEAAEWDRPSFMVCGNKQLLTWVEALLAGKTPELPKHYRSTRRKRFFSMIEKSKALAEADLPQRVRSGVRRVKDAAFDARLTELLKIRDITAQRLDLEPSLIASRAPLESIAAGEVKPEEVMMSWQLNQLGI